MKVMLGGLLAWAFVSGALGRFVDRAAAAVSGQPSPAPQTPTGTPTSAGVA